jgi:uncharacterized protein YbjT (DUF2867 family)
MAGQNGKTVLVLGSTGNQGGAVAKELLKKGFNVMAITRKPDSEKAKALEALGARMVRADLGNVAGASRVLERVWGVFSVLTMAETGVLWEQEQGIKFAEAAKNAGVEHFVYSSVASADKKTGIPHFESKWQIEEKIRSLDFPFYTIIRPVSFMENMLNPRSMAGIEKGVLMMGLRPDAKQQMIAVEDIGRYGALPFEEPEKTNRAAIDIAGDEKTAAEYANILSKITGKQIKAMPTPIDDMRKTMPDFAKMIEWIDKVGYSVDINGLTKKYGIKPISFEDWAKKVKWPSSVNS